MSNARNGVRYSAAEKERARQLRSKGFTHREIATRLGARVSTVFTWTQGIKITASQKAAIEVRRRKSVHHMTSSEKREALNRIRPYMYKQKYSDEELLDRIRDFYKRNGRIPLKHEFNSFRIYKHRFKSWNTAVKTAGFDTNPVLFARHLVSNDGHLCDSFTEKVIDDWLYAQGIQHERRFRYGDTKLTADFKLSNNVIIEFFGLAGVQKRYDSRIQRKRKLAERLDLLLVEIYPKDIYPKNKLAEILAAAGVLTK